MIPTIFSRCLNLIWRYVPTAKTERLMVADSRLGVHAPISLQNNLLG